MKEEKRGVLYLLPSLLGEVQVSRCIPEFNLQVILRLKYFIVEELRTTRRFLRSAGVTGNLDELNFLVFNEHSDKLDLAAFCEPLLHGNDVGLISEAGIPCVADPGSEIVRQAHEKDIRVKPLVGASSLLLALMASGFNGQNFVFHGYLPIEKAARSKKLKELENAVYSKDQTQVFIEVPYRNIQLLQAITETCRNGTMVSVATDLTTDQESIVVKTVANLKTCMPDINKKPTVFLLYR